MIRFFPSEEWREFELEYKSKNRYAVSNFGRIISFFDTIENGRLLKGGVADGYTTFVYQYLVNSKRKHKTIYVRKLVAEKFLKKTSEDQVFVLLLDRNRSNNYVGNLKWATKEEMMEHYKKSPYVIKARNKVLEQKRRMGKGNKLNSSIVKIIKKRISDPNRKTRMKIIAKQFGISEMQLYRIKSGENWGHVTIN